MFLKGELQSILTLSSFFVHLECCQYRQKRQKLPTPCYPLFKIRTLLTSVGPLNILDLSLQVHSHVSGVIKSDHGQSDYSRCER